MPPDSQTRLTSSLLEQIDKIRKELGEKFPVSSQLRVKIIRTPMFLSVPGGINTVLLPAQGMAQIVYFLRLSGIDIDQDDLNIKIHFDNRFGNEKEIVEEKIFYDSGRIINYVRGEEDPHLQSVLEKCERKTGLSGYDIVMFSIPEDIKNMTAVMFALAFSRYVKGRYGPVIAAGGFHFSVYPFLRDHNCCIDYIAEGPGELAAQKIILAVENNLDMQTVFKYHYNAPERFIKKCSYIWPIIPSFDGLPIDKYGYKNNRSIEDAPAEINNLIYDFNESGILILPFRLMNGCSGSCIFCSEPGSGIPLEIMDIDDSVSALKAVKEKHNPAGIFFLDNTINISKKYINKLCDKILGAGLNVLWTACARPDNLDRDTLLKMRAAGCIRLIYGMETASPRILEYIDKKVKVEQIEQTIKWTDEAGIWTGVEIICGFPHEKWEDVELTADFLKRNQKHINMFYCNILDIRDSSRLFLNPAGYGIKNIQRAFFEGQEEFSNLKMICYGYDEINGRAWEEIVRHSVKAYKYLKSTVSNPAAAFPPNEDTHFLFYLYTRYKTKPEIVKYFYETSGVIGNDIYRNHGVWGEIKGFG
ncbi:MAG TPA: B12-binding domain-containing radical SAM protein [bacterium]|nr:B12-binding domain-containing radical SAM protein [bacterium]